MVTDLGLAKKTSGGSDLTNTGAVLGTPSYMPPEQAAGDSIVTTAADIYSLGAIMYELLTGVPPYKGATAVETVMQVLQGPPEAPSKKYAGVDRDLELICMKCLERDPEARYGSALELASDLDAWLLGDAISIKAPSFASLAGRWFRRNQKFVYIGFALLTGLLLTLPFALAFFGDNSDVADVYRHFPADQRPWLFSLGKVPKGLDIAAIAFLFLIFWPSIGLLNALVARPTTIRRAFGAGVLTALVLTGVLFLLMGWMVLLQGSVNATNDQIYVLAEAVWPPKGEQREQTLVRANQLYGGVEDIPHSDRAEIVADRIISDHFASVPTSMLILLGIGCAFSVPVTYGTMLGHLLLRRGHAFWLCAIRYAIAWYSISIAGLAMLVLPVSDFRGLLVIVATVCTAVAYVTVRRWQASRTSHQQGIGQSLQLMKICASWAQQCIVHAQGSKSSMAEPRGFCFSGNQPTRIRTIFSLQQVLGRCGLRSIEGSTIRVSLVLFVTNWRTCCSDTSVRITTIGGQPEHGSVETRSKWRRKRSHGWSQTDLGLRDHLYLLRRIDSRKSSWISLPLSRTVTRAATFSVINPFAPSFAAWYSKSMVCQSPGPSAAFTSGTRI